MQHHKPSGRARIGVLALCGLLSLGLALWLTFPRLQAVQHLASGQQGPVQMPWTFPDISNDNRLDVTLPVHWLTPRRWQIIPDDRLTRLRIDGREVPLDGVRPGGLSDWRHGFDMDLAPWLSNGSHQLEFTVDNTAFSGHLTLRPRPGWRTLLLAAALLPWLLALAQLFRLRRGQTALLACALPLLCCYWAATPWTERDHDVGFYGETGHLAYVEHLVQRHQLPRPDQGWEYAQPPLYYGVAALVWRLADALGLPVPEALQALGLLQWLIFLAASAACLRLGLRRSPAALGVATFALGFWPSGVMHGLRIGNEPALYAAAAVATWLMLCWWRGGRRRHLFGMALAVAVAFLCKSSASALLAAALALVGLRLLRRWRRWRAWLDSAAAAALMLSGVGAALGRNLWYWWHGAMPSWLISTGGGMDPTLGVGNQLVNYLPLDIPVFLTQPWLDSRGDFSGRGNFWNYLLRSALSGEFSFDSRTQRVVAWVWGVALLWLLALLLRRACGTPWTLRSLWRDLPWLLLSLAWLASLAALRHAYPYAPHNDFRFVLPLLVPFILACARGGRLERLLLCAIGFGSVPFFLAL